MDISTSLFIFVIGAITGSFINMAIYRIPRKIKLTFPGSFCDQCKEPLNWYENVPVISYILSLGKCSRCGNRYPLTYLIIEVATGLLFIALYNYAKDIPHFIYLASILTMFIIICIIDFKHFIIPDKLILAIAVISLIYFTYTLGTGIYYFLLSSLILFVVLMGLKIIARFIYGREAFGMGDVKLGAVIGFILGWKPALLAIFFGFLLAGLAIMVMAILRKIKRKSYIPFGPFIIGGMVTYLFFGKIIVFWYFQVFFMH
jgi:leader peptidase (prepilin peptidase) / N-methyltransferase